MSKPLVLVTGASRGIGRGIARCFLDNGYPVAVGFCNNPAGAQQLAAEFSEALPLQIDQSRRSSICAALDMIRQHYGREVEILVNNAAIAQEKPFEELVDTDWDRMLEVNLRGPFVLTQEVLPAMRTAGWGRIINIVSIGGQWGGTNQVHYAAAKAGLINLTRSVAKLYSKEGITCNAVSPGLVATEMTQRELSSISGKKKVAAIPVGRIGTVEEEASAVYYLASEEASYITGQTLNVNGGMYFD